MDIATVDIAGDIATVLTPEPGGKLVGDMYLAPLPVPALRAYRRARQFPPLLRDTD
jgi:hypothetical protein